MCMQGATMGQKGLPTVGINLHGNTKAKARKMHYIYMEDILGTIYCKARPIAGIMQTKARQQQGQQRAKGLPTYTCTKTGNS